MGNSIVQLMQSRVSSPRLTEPAPDNGVMERVYRCALRAPDHMMLRPWRYLIIESSMRVALGDIFADSAIKQDASMKPHQVEKFRAMPMRAPMMVIAISENIAHPKVPVEEQIISCGAGVAYMLLALQAEGYGGVWRTGPLAENSHLKTALGIAAHETLVGFLYIGTPCGELKPVPVTDLDTHFKPWQPPAH
jgi:nitroreductase